MAIKDLYIFHLYVAGMLTPNIELGMQCRDYLKVKYGDKAKLVIIDIFQEMKRAEDENIIATPIIQRVSPLPQKKVFLNTISDERIYAGLDVLIAD